MFFSIRSANLCSSSPRWLASIRRHGDPSLKASLAAATALSTSACTVVSQSVSQSTTALSTSACTVVSSQLVSQSSQSTTALSTSACTVVNQSSQSTTALSTSACTVVNWSVTHSYQPLWEEFTHNNRVHTRKVQGLEEEGPVSTESWYAKMWFNGKKSRHLDQINHSNHFTKNHL